MVITSSSVPQPWDDNKKYFPPEEVKESVVLDKEEDESPTAAEATDEH